MLATDIPFKDRMFVASSSFRNTQSGSGLASVTAQQRPSTTSHGTKITSIKLTLHTSRKGFQ